MKTYTIPGSITVRLTKASQQKENTKLKLIC